MDNDHLISLDDTYHKLLEEYNNVQQQIKNLQQRSHYLNKEIYRIYGEMKQLDKNKNNAKDNVDQVVDKTRKTPIKKQLITKKPINKPPINKPSINKQLINKQPFGMQPKYVNKNTKNTFSKKVQTKTNTNTNTNTESKLEFELQTELELELENKLELSTISSDTSEPVIVESEPVIVESSPESQPVEPEPIVIVEPMKVIEPESEPEPIVIVEPMKIVEFEPEPDPVVEPIPILDLSSSSTNSTEFETKLDILESTSEYSYEIVSSTEENNNNDDENILTPDKLSNRNYSDPNKIPNYTKLKTLKVLKVGGKSKYVKLLDGMIIKKKYDRHKPSHVDGYNYEVKILRYLENRSCDYVPRILHLIPEKCIIYMTYCGKSPPRTSSSYKNIISLAQKLDKEHNLARIDENGKKYYKIYINNVCIDDKGKYFLIDFGSTVWQLGQ